MADRLENVLFPVTQAINPWTINFNLGNSPQPTVSMGISRDADAEQRIVQAVGSYGRQIGRIAEALGVMIDRLETLEKAAGITAPPTQAITDFRLQLDAVLAIKALNA